MELAFHLTSGKPLGDEAAAPAAATKLRSRATIKVGGLELLNAERQDMDNQNGVLYFGTVVHNGVNHPGAAKMCQDAPGWEGECLLEMQMHSALSRAGAKVATLWATETRGAEHWSLMERLLGGSVADDVEVRGPQYRQGVSGAEKQADLLALCAALKSLHDAGYYQGDVHAGNYGMVRAVVRPESSTLRPFKMLDLGRAGPLQEPGALSAAARVAHDVNGLAEVVFLVVYGRHSWQDEEIIEVGEDDATWPRMTELQRKHVLRSDAAEHGETMPEVLVDFFDKFLAKEPKKKVTVDEVVRFIQRKITPAVLEAASR